MFQLADGRQHVYQWDINIKLLLDDADESVDEVHFSSRFSRTSISVEVVRVDGHPYVMIPNILLQKHADIIAYFYVSNADGSYTKYDTTIPVIPRAKPSGYIYKETEILTWNTLDKKISELSGKKVDKDQGVENAGKTLVIGADGNVVPGNVNLSEDETLNLLIEEDMLPAVYNADGAILTDQNGNIVFRY